MIHRNYFYKEIRNGGMRKVFIRFEDAKFPKFDYLSRDNRLAYRHTRSHDYSFRDSYLADSLVIL
jgi:hypothetical protein